MSKFNDIAEISDSNGIKKGQAKTFLDFASLAITTFGVGYLPLAPGTWGSIVGVIIYLVYKISIVPIIGQNFSSFFALTAILLVVFCIVGILASARVEKLLNNKDPQIIIVDEIMGQLIVFAFVPFGISWTLVIAGFVLFRLFDIWKPYPVRNFESLPNGIGVCADDIVAGVYGGVCLSILYAIGL